MYQVKLRQFEGPFELLIDLIDKKKLSINEVSLVEVADQYLNHLKRAEHFPLREVAAFIVVAATLMLIKSRSLMPSLKFSEEEELEIENLEEQLRLYKQFRALAGGLEKIFGKKVIFAREAFLQTEIVFIEPKDLSIFKIKAALKEVLKNMPQKEALPQTIVKKTISLEQRIDDLVKRLQTKVSMCFSEIKNSPECKKIDLIVSFLALLELTKREFIIIKQSKIFGEIEITKHKT
jgi:segregation and condensation protein A